MCKYYLTILLVFLTIRLIDIELYTLQIISFDQHGCFDTRSIKWLEKLTDRSTVNKFLSQISFVFAYGLGAAELRRLIMISDDSMKNHYQQQLNKLIKK